MSKVNIALILVGLTRFLVSANIYLCYDDANTLEPAGQLNALANSGIFESVPSTRYLLGECGSVRILANLRTRKFSIYCEEK